MKKNIIILTSIYLICLVSCNIKEHKIDENISDNLDTITEIIIPTDRIKGRVKNIHEGCGYNYSVENFDFDLYLPEPREIQELKNILEYSGIPMNFEFYAADIDNAIATIVDNRRYIIYDPALFNYVDKFSGTYWTSVSILAHEIGHHLSGHTLTNSLDKHAKELEADKFSGFLLYKMGASISQAVFAITSLGTEEDTESHPSKYRRITAIEEGWNLANKQRFDSAVPPSPSDDIKHFYKFTLEMLINRDYIEEDVYGHFYSNLDYCQGVVLDVEDDFSSFKVKIFKTGKSYFRNLDNENWQVYLNEVNYGGNSEMCHACAGNLRSLIIPGRRIKFSMVEGCPGCGTAYNGVWSLAYIEAIAPDSM